MQNCGLLRRGAAIFYDTLLVAAVLFMFTIPFIAIRSGEPVEAGNFVYQLTMFLVTYVFFVGFWTRKGRTLGMQSWGLRLQTLDGKIPSMSMASIRFFAAIISWVPFGLGFAWQLWDKDTLAWHDRISGTRLVYYPKQP